MNRESTALQRQGIGLGTLQHVSEFAPRVLARAKEIGISKAQLAARAGLSRQTLDNLLAYAEGGDAAMPAMRTFIQLGHALRVHPSWLIEGLFGHVAVDTRIDVHRQANRSPNVLDLTFAQGAVAAPSARLLKAWRIRNDTQEQWKGLRLVCCDGRITLSSHQTGLPLHATSGLHPDVAEVALPDLPPGDSTDVHIGFTAPPTAGATVSRWLALGPDGLPVSPGGFGAWFLVHVTTLADTLAFEPLPG